MDFNTKAVHSGVAKDSSYNSVITPIYATSTFYWDRLGVNQGYDYTRSGNPTRSALAENLAALEGGAAAFCTGTGMSAITGVLGSLQAGDHVIAGHDIYGGTYRLLHSVFTRLGISFDFINQQDLDLLRSSIRDNTRLIWIETPSNPLLNIIDIQAITAIAREAGILTAVDNTFLSPYFQSPFELGADIIVHSTTKYINGHSDVVGGAIIARTPELGEKLGFYVNALGLSEAPFDSWLVLRGVKTLALRMQQHARNAQAIAEYLDSHPRVKQVYYPGLPAHPGQDIIRRQHKGNGAIVSFELDTAAVDMDDFFKRLRYYQLAESLGGVESLIEAPWFMSHASMPESAREAAGITRGCVRISVGIEDSPDLIQDLEQALGK